MQHLRMPFYTAFSIIAFDMVESAFAPTAFAFRWFAKVQLGLLNPNGIPSVPHWWFKFGVVVLSALVGGEFTPSMGIALVSEMQSLGAYLESPARRQGLPSLKKSQ